MTKEVNRRIFYGIIVIAVFFLLTFTTLYYNKLHEFVDALRLTPFFIVLSFIVGAGTYAFMSERLERKEQTIKKNVDMILKFLNEDERKVIEKLIENNGKALQAEITRLPGMSKLRSHRTIKKLLIRKIVETEKLGKTNIVKLAKDIKEGLL